MHRWIVCLVLVGSSLAACPAHAKNRHRDYPPRYRRGSMADYIAIPRTDHVQVRQVYNGYVNGFPAPAYLYYQYPHSGYTYGIGF